MLSFDAVRASESEMLRRTFIVLVGATAGLPFTARGQQQAIPVIGYLGAGSANVRIGIVDAFRQGLSENGYVEGRNVAIEYRWAEGRTERFPALAAELVARPVDVIVTVGGTLAAQAAQRATPTIPIVFQSVGDPVAEGLVASLARPGGNITGLSFFAAELTGKRLELLKQAAPETKLIALLIKPDSMPDAAREARIREAKGSARALGVGLRVVEARGPEDFDQAFSEMSEARADALTVFATPVYFLALQRIAALAANNRLPAISESRDFADVGGLMTYGPNLADLARRAGVYAAKILKGAKPADLPVEQPTKFELVINVKTAKALGLTVPQSLLARADEVIE
jgi:putative tryptophan/tyrosine transport system substrate-binding protein